jgi:hypothetical protein
VIFLTNLVLSGSQHYALAGLSTCLVIHNQDPTVDYLLNCKIGTSPVTCNKNLTAVRLETTKVCFLTSYPTYSMSPCMFFLSVVTQDELLLLMTDAS